MKAISSLAIALAIATSASAQQQEKITAPTIFSMRAGETVLLTTFVWITRECVSTFTGFDGIDILDGPPEITLKFEPGKVVSAIAQGGKVCKPVDGGHIMITANDISEHREEDLTFRVRFRNKQTNSATWTGRYHLLLFPSGSGHSGEQSSK
jgi:hypothetical protein